MCRLQRQPMRREGWRPAGCASDGECIPFYLQALLTISQPYGYPTGWKTYTAPTALPNATEMSMHTFSHPTGSHSTLSYWTIKPSMGLPYPTMSWSHPTISFSHPTMDLVHPTGMPSGDMQVSPGITGSLPSTLTASQPYHGDGPHSHHTTMHEPTGSMPHFGREAPTSINPEEMTYTVGLGILLHVCEHTDSFKAASRYTG